MTIHNSREKNLRPFKKGADARRNPLGRVSQARSTWMAKFLNALAEKLDPDEAAEVFVKRYRAGIPFFVGEAHERLGGKVTQPIEAEQNIVYRVIYEKPAKDKVDANG
jgi:hypothetical protein